MALLPYPLIDDIEDPALRALMREAPALNLLLMESHAQGVVEAVMYLSYSVLNRSVAPRNLRAIAFLRLCGVVGSTYEYAQLAKVARNFGLSEEKIEAARDGRRSVLTPEEILVVQLAEELASGPKASRETLRALESILSAREICELIIGIGFYLMQSRVIETLELELEDPPVALPLPSGEGPVVHWHPPGGASRSAGGFET